MRKALLLPKEIWENRKLILKLAGNDFRTRYAGSYLGIFCAFLGMISLIVIVLRKIFVPNIAVGYTSTISILLFIGGLIMLILGFLGEYIGRIYMTVSGAPQYQIREVMNDEENE